MSADARHAGASIWLYAALYFACYTPYTALTKALSAGEWPGQIEPIPGPTVLPVATAVSLVVTGLFLWGSGWWRSASRRQVAGLSLPVPTRWTALSGLCTALILLTTTLAYTFEGVSIVFVMLLMRGGVLAIAPVVDALTGRRGRWYSWAGLGLSMTALLVAFAERGGYHITALCAVDVAIYLASYFVRLQFMSRLAKSEDPAASRRYFVEEQLVAVPASLALLALGALWGQGEFLGQLRDGFTTHLRSDMLWQTALIGALSQGTGIFGTLTLLDKRENTFSVPVNRCASVLAGVAASFLLAAWLGSPLPSQPQLLGAALVIVAIAALGLGPAAERRKKARS